VDNADSMHTLAHEMGHAFHSELSRSQGPLYCGYSTSLAETASTLFEGLAQEAEMEGLSPARQIVALANKINSEITMIFRSIACFNFESDLHAEIRSTGFVPKERIAALHNKNMQAYLGDTFELIPDDGYFFVAWHHIRRFFYVYSYAYGILVSKALLRRYKQDKSFWKKIEQFLSAGGKDSPENILKEIGIDVSKPSFWKEGLKEIEDDISKLEKLTKK
jgi:oligoendopeptidase F